MNEEEVYLVYYKEDCIYMKPVCVFESGARAEWFVRNASTKEIEFEIRAIKLVKGFDQDKGEGNVNSTGID